MAKERITLEIERAVRQVAGPDADPADLPAINLFAPSQADRGDYSTDIALRLARFRKDAAAARPLANAIARQINETSDSIESATVGGDGIVNLRLKPDLWTELLRRPLAAGNAYGHALRPGAENPVLLEFVSANPNAALSAAHARGGVVGDVLAALHTAAGHEVQREFYANDSEEARPLRAFSRAVFAHYLRHGEHDAAALGAEQASTDLEEYSGEFAEQIAERVYQAEGDRFATESAAFSRVALLVSQDHQREALADFGIRFDNWSRESELVAAGEVSRTVDALRTGGFAHMRDGALWLESTRFGDDVDRVLMRADGKPTYLAADLAYHRAKFERGFQRLIDVWSADHATYVTRTRAGLEALGYDPAQLDVVVFQSVRVLKDGTTVKGGANGLAGGAASAVTLRDLVSEIGVAAARFHLLLQPPGEVLDLDLDVARSAAGPLARVRRALALVRSAATSEIDPEKVDATELLSIPADRNLLRTVSEFPAVITEAVTTLSPHLIATYAARLADTILHAHDRKPKSAAREGFPSGAGLSDAAVIVEAPARAALAAAAAITLQNALILMGISPDAAPS